MIDEYINSLKNKGPNSVDTSNTNIIDTLSPQQRAEFDKDRSERAQLSILTAINGNFKGELEVEWWWSTGLFYCYSHRYRITRSNGQQGGNKANLEFNFASNPNGQRFETKSGDNMNQTGIWLPYSQGGWIGSPAGDRVIVFAKFTFDKSGTDPVGADSFYLTRP